MSRNKAGNHNETVPHRTTRKRKRSRIKPKTAKSNAIGVLMTSFIVTLKPPLTGHCRTEGSRKLEMPDLRNIRQVH